MVNRLNKQDMADLSMVDEDELWSQGFAHSPFQPSLTIVSVVAATKTVTFVTSVDFKLPQVAEWDWLKITTGVATGVYTIDEVVGSGQSWFILKVKEAILDATSGNGEIYYRAGTQIIGFENTYLGWPLPANTAQHAIEYAKSGAIENDTDSFEFGTQSNNIQDDYLQSFFNVASNDVYEPTAYDIYFRRFAWSNSIGHKTGIFRVRIYKAKMDDTITLIYDSDSAPDVISGDRGYLNKELNISLDAGDGLGCRITYKSGLKPAKTKIKVIVAKR